MSIFSNQSRAFGLDISEFSLKIARLQKKSGGFDLLSFGREAVPSGIIEDSKVQETKALSLIIKKAIANVKGKKIKTKKVIISLPEEKSFLDVFRLPKVKEEELSAAVRFEAEHHIPMGLDDVYLDFELMSDSDIDQKYQQVLVSASPKVMVDSYLEALKMAGLQTQVVEVECMAVARAVVKEVRSQKPLLIIDFGENRASFMIFSGASLRFTSTIPFSSSALNQGIAQRLKIDLKKAEQLKKSEGLIGKKAVFNAILPLISDFVRQIKSHIKYYRSHSFEEKAGPGGHHLSKILLCGGGANLKGLPELLSSSLEMRVELANPWVNILKQPLCQVPSLPFEESLSYATALGLALRAFYEN